MKNINISGEGEVGISNPNLSSNTISIYPNPGNGLVNIDMVNEDFSTVEVLSITGKLVRSFELTGTTGSYDLTELQSGLYFVVFVNENTNKQATHKLIIR